MECDHPKNQRITQNSFTHIHKIDLDRPNDIYYLEICKRCGRIVKKYREKYKEVV